MTFSLNKKTQPFELNPYNSIIKFRNNYLKIKSVEMIVVENTNEQEFKIKTDPNRWK